MTARVRVVDAGVHLGDDSLAAALAQSADPALVIASTDAVAQYAITRLRPQDDLGWHDEPAAVHAARERRLAERQALAAELDRRRDHVDPMTGLPDRYRLVKWLETDDNAWPSGPCRGLVLIDLDFFRRFNEAHGEAAGDHVLRVVAGGLRELSRPPDLVFRLELAQFVVIMDRVDPDEVAAHAEALRRSVATAAWAHAEGVAHVTASAGLAFLRSHGFRYASMQQADAAMYMAKVLGRDRLVRHEDLRRLAADAGTTLELSDLSEQADATRARLIDMAGDFNRRLLEEARLEASIDGLTGVRNRRYFDDRLARQLALARRDASRVSLALLDIDDFREFNKVHGHPTGDAVLRGFAEAVTRTIRDRDWFARYGGEEFCLVMEATAEEACQVAERIRDAVSRTPLASLDGQPVTITVTIGVAAFDPARDASPEHLVQRASRANRAAKDSGKNRVVAG